MIEKLDVERPQVSVEALIMELTVNDSQDLGFSGLLRIIDGDEQFALASATSAADAALGGAARRPAIVAPAASGGSSATRATSTRDGQPRSATAR